MKFTADMERLALRLAERHRIPETDIVHPKVFVPDGRGGIDEFMTEKLREPHYVPYCLVGIECARVRRRDWGFECPNCGNKMNWDLTHYDGNKNVKFDGPAPAPKPLSIAEHNAEVERKRTERAVRRAQRK